MQEDLIQLGLACPLQNDQKITDIESNNGQAETQTANSQAIKQEDGSAKPPSRQKLSISLVYSKAPSIRISNQRASRNDDEVEQVNLEAYANVDESSGVPSRSRAQSI